MRSTAEPITGRSILLCRAFASGAFPLVGSVVERRRGNADTQPRLARGRPARRQIDGRGKSGREQQDAGVAPGPLHTLSPVTSRFMRFLPGGGHSRASARAFYSPAVFAAQRPVASPSGDGTPACFAFKLKQAGLPYSINDLTDERAYRLPTDVRVVSLVAHAQHDRHGAAQCFASRERPKCP